MKCIICETELNSISPENSPQSELNPDNGGIVLFEFGFGSKFDWMGYRNPIRGGPVTIYKNFFKKGKDLHYQDTVDTEPHPERLKSQNRTEQLCACRKIIGVICDSCFEKKSHLFVGYECDKDNTNYRKLV